MKDIYVMDWDEVYDRVDRIRAVVRTMAGQAVFGVPRGGAIVAGLVGNPTKVATNAAVIVDDIIDSGRTRARYQAEFDVPFLALVDKTGADRDLGWVQFPWEGRPETETEDTIVRLLEFVGEDPRREGLKDTPTRVTKAWQEWTSGYRVDVPGLFKCFADGSEGYNEMVVVKDLPFYSHCEHHLAPFFGTATIAYLPDAQVIGLSKLGRLLGAYSKRLQVQERLTTQIADALMTHLRPKGAGVIVKARHLCMESRGLSQQGHCTVTSALRGVFVEDNARTEFLNIARL